MSTQATNIKVQILSSGKKLRTMPVKTPEWGVEGLLIRELTLDERKEFEDRFQSDQDEATKWLREDFIIATLIDKDRNQIFEESDKSEIGKLGSVVTDRIFNLSQKFSGITETQIQEEEKN